MNWFNKLLGKNNAEQGNKENVQDTQSDNQKKTKEEPPLSSNGVLMPDKCFVVTEDGVESEMKNLTSSQESFLAELGNGKRELEQMFEQMKQQMPFAMNDPTADVIPDCYSLAVLANRDVVDAQVFSGKAYTDILLQIAPDVLSSQLILFYGVLGYGMANKVAFAFQSKDAKDLAAVAEIFNDPSKIEGLLPLETRYLSAPSRDGNIIPRSFALQKVASLDKGRIVDINSNYKLQFEVASENTKWKL